ncbi:hypothetical protein [Sphingopyxis flava]|uniref:Uncharacterized protein n=1 Tax=Sphingopyxis flava TaxID=1507287 RepID=A0A1T5BQ18_9SPHN|nr:hypothetical protein [Sphingopyxis flava]SKB49326.1 hypothetical protein SAMN06295937_100751 [Sphingopyxis flava]
MNDPIVLLLAALAVLIPVAVWPVAVWGGLRLVEKILDEIADTSGL